MSLRPRILLIAGREILQRLSGFFTFVAVEELESERLQPLPPRSELAEFSCCFFYSAEAVEPQTLGILAESLPLVAITCDNSPKGLQADLIRVGVQEVATLSQLNVELVKRLFENAEARFNTKKEAREREKMFLALCDTLPFQMAYRIVVEPGKKAKFVYVSEGIEHISGLSREQIIDNADLLYQQIVPEDRARFHEVEDQAVKNLSAFEIEVRKRNSAGRLLWVHIRSFPTQLKNGTIIWDGVEADITSYKRSEEAVKELLAKNQILLESERHARSESERSGRIKDEFLATLSHELRTPINAVLGWAQLIKRGGLNPETTKKAIDIIERNAYSQSRLISDLLDMNRIMTGQVQLSSESIDVCEIALTAIESIKPDAEANGVAVKFYTDSSVPLRIRGDSGKFQQMISNLLSNSLKFTPKGGNINLRVVQIGSEVELSIIDTGLGIKPDFLPFVFERFRQADPSFSRQYGGLGLGLAIVKQLVLMHEGTIRAYSEGEGKGATFTLRFPLLESGVNAVLNDEEAFNESLLQPHVLEHLRILVVDDEPDALELVTELLEQCGAAVIPALSADAALQATEEKGGKIDVVISDIGMPGKDGFDFIREFRQRFKQEIPAIALTAFARLEDRANVLAAGFSKHVPKPVDAVELVSVVLSLNRGLENLVQNG